MEATIFLIIHQMQNWVAYCYKGTSTWLSRLLGQISGWISYLHDCTFTWLGFFFDQMRDWRSYCYRSASAGLALFLDQLRYWISYFYNSLFTVVQGQMQWIWLILYSLSLLCVLLVLLFIALQLVESIKKRLSELNGNRLPSIKVFLLETWLVIKRKMNASKYYLRRVWWASKVNAKALAQKMTKGFPWTLLQRGRVQSTTLRKTEGEGIIIITKRGPKHTYI